MERCKHTVSTHPWWVNSPRIKRYIYPLGDEWKPKESVDGLGRQMRNVGV